RLYFAHRLSRAPLQRRRRTLLGNRRLSHVADVALLHAPHLRAHDPAHHLQVAVAQAESRVHPGIGDVIQLLAGDAVHAPARAQRRLHAVAVLRVARNPFAYRALAFAVLADHVHHAHLVQLSGRQNATGEDELLRPAHADASREE